MVSLGILAILLLYPREFFPVISNPRDCAIYFVTGCWRIVLYFWSVSQYIFDAKVLFIVNLWLWKTNIDFFFSLRVYGHRSVRPDYAF